MHAFLRLAGCIALETVAFIVWNVGTRSPAGVVRDMARAVRDGRKMLAGTLRALIGSIFMTAAVVLLLPVLPDPIVDFLPAQLFTLLVALAIEHLIGNDARAVTSARR